MITWWVLIQLDEDAEVDPDDVTFATIDVTGLFDRLSTFPDDFTFLDMHSDRVLGSYLGEQVLLSYHGGDGNDVVIYTTPEPGSVALMLGGIGGLLARRRRRAA